MAWHGTEESMSHSKVSDSEQVRVRKEFARSCLSFQRCVRCEMRSEEEEMRGHFSCCVICCVVCCVLYGRLDARLMRDVYVGAVVAEGRDQAHAWCGGGRGGLVPTLLQYATCPGLKPRRYLSRETWSENFEAHPWLPLSL